MAQDIRAIFSAPSLDDAKLLLDKVAGKYEKRSSRLSHWLQNNILDGLTVMALPQTQWRSLRTTNGLERINQEIRRRTRVVGIFPNEVSCLPLVSAVLMGTSDEWETGRAYMIYDTRLLNL